MKKPIFISLYCILLLLIFSHSSFAQCTTDNSMGVCSGGNGQLNNNTSVNSGMTFWWSAASGTGSLSNIGMQGGTLVVCGGDLTITSGSFINGTIIVMGGTLTFDFAVTLFNTTKIVNYSDLNFTNGLTMSGIPARIFNNSGGTLNVTGTTTINNNSSIINNSTFATDNLTLNGSSGPAICQGGGAIVNVSGDFTNGLLNSIESPSSSSCIFMGNNIQLNLDVSPDATLNVCDSPGGTTSGPATWGAAKIFSPCGTCPTILPIELELFYVKKKADGAEIVWATSQEISNDYFVIQRSVHQNEWEDVYKVEGQGDSHELSSYQYINPITAPDVYYYRLKQVDFDGQFTYSQILYADFTTDNEELIVYPNPTENIVNIMGDGHLLKTLALYNTYGENMMLSVSIIQKGDEELIIDLRSLPTGIYYLKGEKTINKIHKK
ncbi:MAG: T9SS type A sorting domain-containing protein [Cytophagales bacterium]|nr:T9SS type A sorting domain-containing protein [Cytophagales bacterium]